MDNAIAMIAQMTFDLSNTPSNGPSTINAVENAFSRLTLDDDSTTSASQHHSILPPNGDIQRLILLDHKLDAHMKNILQSLDQLAHPDPTMQQNIQLDLLQEQSSLCDTLQEVRGLDHHPQVGIHVLAEAMRERLEQFSAAIDIYVTILHERTPPSSNPRVVKSGTTDR